MNEEWKSPKRVSDETNSDHITNLFVIEEFEIPKWSSDESNSDHVTKRFDNWSELHKQREEVSMIYK